MSGQRPFGFDQLGAAHALKVVLGLPILALALLGYTGGPMYIVILVEAVIILCVLVRRRQVTKRRSTS
jgi:hypothetical protein